MLDSVSLKKEPKPGRRWGRIGICYIAWWMNLGWMETALTNPRARITSSDGRVGAARRLGNCCSSSMLTATSPMHTETHSPVVDRTLVFARTMLP